MYRRTYSNDDLPESIIDDLSVHSSSSTSESGNDGDVGGKNIKDHSVLGDSIHNHSTSNDTGTGKSSADDSENNRENIKNQISKKESIQVMRLKWSFIILKLFVATAVAFTIYYMTSHSENEEYEVQYYSVASTITDSFHHMINRIGSVSSISKAATIYGIDQYKHSNGTIDWPFHTITHFQQRAATARLLSGSLYMSMPPVVTENNRIKWEEYVNGPDRKWIEEGLEFQTKMGYDDFLIQNITSFDNHNQSSKIFYIDDDDNTHTIIEHPGPGPYIPRWITSPIVSSQLINQDIHKKSSATQTYLDDVIHEKNGIFRNFEHVPPGNIDSDNDATSFFATLRSIKEGHEVPYLGDPLTRLYIPVYDTFDTMNNTVVAVISSLVEWRSYLQNILSNHVIGIDVVINSTTCNETYTYRINGADAHQVGYGDLHETKYNSYKQTVSMDALHEISDGTNKPIILSENGCFYELDVFPSQVFYESVHSTTPITLTVSMALVMLFTVFLFLCYDRLVEKRQHKVLTNAVQSTAIVTSLFPKNIRDQLLKQNDENDGLNKGLKNNKASTSNQLMSFIKDGADRQLAELYTNCTVMFADISGFTAWCSTRDPEQVFVLLQTVFNAFDRIAKRRKVFKVETIGDCYVAVTGLPEPQINHAIIMSRFAWECRTEMHKMTRALEKRLGPDCSDLKMRFGLNSGPVTAGVLLGDRARFQLFGDTVNTAARMESNGIRDKVQLSQTTADVLMTSGKAHWLKPRDQLIEAKGKGSMQTYWLNLGTKKAFSATTDTSGDVDDGTGLCDDPSTQPTSNHDDDNEINEKQERLVDWMVEILAERLRKMLEHRGSQTNEELTEALHYQPPPGSVSLDEIKEVIPISKFIDAALLNGGTVATPMEGDDSDLGLTKDVISDLRDYVSVIAKMYHDNPFHNFEHACHVTMSVNKLLKRIISVDADEIEHCVEGENDAIRLNTYSYGLCNDHMASFAIVFSALIHDVDHKGCSNVQLVKEQESLGVRYRNQSVAEQNSIDISWDLLMESRFDNLRRVIFGNQVGLMRFRQFIVNLVLATDIFDKELNALRAQRWTKAFSEDEILRCHHDQADRKATIVIVHLMQASDISHTMQHWQIYRKWNKLLFHEMHLAYEAGRMGADPAAFWYEGEIKFFDNYVIPLANKLKECNVFGVSSDEYLNYAVGNRAEWAAHGQQIVEEMIDEFKRIKNQEQEQVID